MTASLDQSESQRWSSRKWRLYALSIFALQFIALFFLSNRQPPFVRYAAKRTSFYFVGEPAKDGPLAWHIRLNDPALFALPNLHGFSGSAWLNPPKFEYQFTNWTEQPRLLEMSEAESLSPGRQRFAAKILDALPERPIASFFEPAVSASSAEVASRCWLVGSLLDRPILASIQVPVQYYSEILSNTVVQVGVDDGGSAISARLLRGSGWKQADDDALKISRGARFRPKPGYDPSGGTARSDLEWGVIVYQWATLHPAQTNRPPGTP